jgi:peptidyl-prolyl cis-trans isomerase D
MLKAMRTGAQSMVIKLALFGMLVMAMAGLAVMDVTGMVRNGMTDTTVARVAGEKVSAQDFERMVNNTLHEKNIPRNVAATIGLPLQVLTQEINGRLFSHAARDLGIYTDDKSAAKSLRALLEPMVKEGVSEKDALNRMLTSMGMSEDRAVAAVKTQMATDTLLKSVSTGGHAPQILIDAAGKFRREQRKGDYFVLSAADAGKVDAPSDAALKEYYKTVAAQFAQPERRDIALLIIDKKSLGIEQKTDEATLKKYYEEHKADYTTPETRVIGQAVTDDEAVARAVYGVAKETKDLKKAVEIAGKGKAKFLKALAPTTEKEMPEELSAAAFKPQDAGAVEPVKSPLGWDVMYVEKITPGTVKSYESVRNDIAKETADDKSSEVLYEQANKIDDALAGGKTLAEVARERSLKPVSLTKVDATGTGIGGGKAGEGVPALAKVLEQAFRAQKGETPRMIEAPTGEFVIVAVNEVYPPENRPFEEVKAKVLDSWKQKETAGLLDRQSAKIAERLKGGEDFAKVAASFGKTPAATDWISRNTDAAKAKLDKALLPTLFSLPKDGAATAAPDEAGIIVVRLASHRTDPAPQTKEDLASFTATLDHALGQDATEQYRAALIAKYDVTINEKLVRDMFKAHEEEN